MKTYTFKNHLKESLKDIRFRDVWKKGDLEYQLARQIIRLRIQKKLSQRALAKKLKTTQAKISQVERMTANPSLAFLKKIGEAFDKRVSIRIT
ncbi:MAG TPA: transcriptional regulator [Candidatus Pacebacteria bacterium]|nr:MAG: Transcriptional regulator, XRE family [Microgenomates group bacterium GW2011_GWB1_45_17]KKU22766.1 MAG: Transcriptional regulator, XRE family [Microgenomates group bacterium GW2011_GWA1_46_15]KKU24028.1 MAG: Transcriptional regulator, XRE family [Microgenomates group bacterium GW2011_GWC1_46_15]HAV14878.1 transcriptional regulator [Candidatus Paceibacterota bacterium]HCR11626.1 transcriptional regulator [Candidatus Paceibacterota bacterium]